MSGLLLAASAGAQGEIEPTSSHDLSPDPGYLSPPEIDEPLYACTERVSVRGVVPDATIEIEIDGVAVAAEVAARGDWTVRVPPVAAGDVVRARQVLGSVRSDPDEAVVADPRRDFPTLPAPSIWDEELPLYACGRYVGVIDFVSGATVEAVDLTPDPDVVLDRRATSSSTVWTSANVAAPGLAEGHEVTARYALCTDQSPDAPAKTVRPEPARLPPLRVQIFENDYGSGRPPQAVFHDRVPGAAIDVFVDGAPYATITGISGQVNLRNVRAGALVTGVQRLCNVASPVSAGEPVPPATTCADLPPAEIRPPEIGDTQVVVTRSVPGARIMVFSRGVEIGDGGGSRIQLRRPLRAGDDLVVLQLLGSCRSRQVQHIAVHCNWIEEVSLGAPPFPTVGTVDYFIPGVVKLAPSGLEATFQGTVRYPAIQAGSGSEIVPGRFPLVIVLHGRHGRYVVEGGAHSCATKQPGSQPVITGFVQNHKGYGYLLDRLARFGYVVASIDANDINCSPFDGQAPGQIEERAELIKRHLSFFGYLDDPQSVPIPWPGTAMVLSLRDLFAGHVDLTQVAVVGHSRGAEAAVRAGRDCRPGHTSATCGVVPAAMNVLGVVAVAPTDITSTTVDGIPLLMVLPANDGDVCDDEGARIYDRAAPDGAGGWFKSQLYYYGANHNFFNTEWGDEWTLPNRCGMNRPVTAAGPDQPMPHEQRETLASWTVAFLELVLRGEERYRPVLSGDGRIAGLAANPFLWPSYQRAGALLVDDHEDARALRNSLGGRVTPNGFDVYDEFVLGPPTPGAFAHETAGAIGRWFAPSDVVSEFAPRDVSAFGFASLRLSQVRDGANQRNRPMVLELGLKDARSGSATAWVPTTEFRPIPFPYAHPLREKSVLHTVRLPLHCFGPERDSDRTRVESLSIRTAPITPAGVVALDQLEFTD